MKKHEGNLEITKNGEYDFAEITGNLTVREGVKANFPALTSYVSKTEFFALLDEIRAITGGGK